MILRASHLARLRRIRREIDDILAEAEAEQACMASNDNEADDDEAVERKAQELRQACVDRGITVTGDGYVRECDAARLLRKAPQTLRNRRGGARPLPFRKNGRTVEYGLEAIAEYLVGREYFPE